MASSRTTLVVAVVVSVLVGAGGSYFYQSTQVTSLQNQLTSANESNAMLKAEMQNSTSALPLVLQPGQTIQGGWIVIIPTGTGHYALSVRATGLKPPSSGAYIVEGVAKQATNMAPITANATASEFEADNSGVGNYWIVLSQNPSTNFGAIDLLYLPGMQMTNAVLVATVKLG